MKKKSKSVIVGLLLISVIFLVSCEKETTEPMDNDITVTDIDGNIYQTVQIGTQLWMAENLKVTHFRNGDAIPHIINDDEWINTNNGAYCFYNNTLSNAEIYGNLYNWFAVDDIRCIAPEGWHIPTDDEIKELEITLGMSESEADNEGGRGTNEGSKLAGSDDLWENSSLEENSEFGTSGFSLLPGGYRQSSNGHSLDMGYTGYFWSSSVSNNAAWKRDLFYHSTKVDRSSRNKNFGFSVRCIRD